MRAGDAWVTRVFRDGERAALAAIDCTLDVDEIYRDPLGAWRPRVARIASAVAKNLGASAKLLTSGGLVVGDAHACVILANNGVNCWGHNGSGQLGVEIRPRVGTRRRSSERLFRK